MKRTRYLLLTLLLTLVGMNARAQFNPTNPAEPNAFFHLTVLASPAKAGTAKGAGNYIAGTKVAVSTTAADTQWQFTCWTNSDGDTVSVSTSFTYTTQYKGEVLTANYKVVPTSTVTLLAKPATGGSLSGAGTYKVGTKATVSASVNSNFVFAGWTDEQGNLVSEARQFSYTVTESDVTFVAHYDYNPSSPSEPTQTKAKHRVYFTSYPSAAGYFSKTSGNDLVTEDASYSVTAYTNSGWVFDSWTDLDSGEQIATTSGLTIVMGTADRHLQANYRFEPTSPSEPTGSSKSHFSLYGFSQEFYGGQTVLFPFYLENTGTVAALTFSLLVPSELVAGDALTTSRTSAYTIAKQETGSDSLGTRYTFTLTGGTAFADANGKIMDLRISAAEGIVSARCRIVFEGGTVTTADGASQPLSFRDGYVDVLVDESDLRASFTCDRYLNRAQFTDQSVGATRLLWDFGDGTTSDEHNPLHVYEKPGTYHVRLTAYGIVADNMAEQSVIVNPTSSWTASGDYTLSDTLVGLRNFCSTEEMMALLSQCTVTGDLRVAVDGNTDYVIDIADATAMDRMENFSTALGTHAVTFTAPDGEPSGIDIRTASDPTQSGSVAGKAAAFRFLLHADGTNVVTTLDGASVNASFLTQNVSQTICTRGTTAAVPFSSVFPSATEGVAPAGYIVWHADSQPSALSGYEAKGSGDMPAMTIVSSGRQRVTLVYTIDVYMSEVLVHQGSYTIYVDPSKDIDPSDKAALQALYDATGGSHWTKPWNLAAATVETGLNGVTFDADGHVTALALNGNNLVGDVPADGFVLPYLTSLNLSHNSLKGNIAQFVGSCPSLKTLTLSYNQFDKLETPLPAAITSFSIGYQFTEGGIETLTLQTLPLSQTLMGLQLPSLFTYNHAKQQFGNHPRLNIYTTAGSYIGYLMWTGNAYELTPSGDYAVVSGGELYLKPYDGNAIGSVMRVAFTYPKGDANMDNVTDVLDAQHSLNYILGRQSGLFNYNAANTYKDQTINVQDIVCTVNIILGGILPDDDEEPDGGDPESSPRSRKAEGEHTARLFTDATAQGSCLVLQAEQGVAALVVTLEGIHSDGLSLNLSHKRWQMVALDTESGVRVCLFSPTGDTLPIGDTQLLVLYGDATVTDATAADVDAAPVPMAIGKATAIRTATTDADTHAVYDLSGRRVKDAVPGLYIVDGKKTIVK